MHRLALVALLLTAACSSVRDRRTGDRGDGPTGDDPTIDDPAAGDAAPVDPTSTDPGCERAAITLVGWVDVADARSAEGCDVLVAGSYAAAVELGGTPVTAHEHGPDGFLARMDERGVPRWIFSLGTEDSGMDRIFDAVSDQAGGAYFTGFYRRDLPDGDDFTNVAGAVDADGAPRWTVDLAGPAVVAEPRDGVVRVVVEAPGTIEVLDLDEVTGDLLRRAPLASGPGGAYAIDAQGGRFVALVGFGEGSTLAGTTVTGSGDGIASVIVERDGTMRLGSITPAPGLQIWHSRIGASSDGVFAAVLAFTGPLDVGGTRVVSPPLVDPQGLSTAVVSFDASGAIRGAEAFLTTGSMRAIGVSIDADGAARAMIGISDDVLDVDGVRLDGNDEEARALIGVGVDGVVDATATRAEKIWGQADGTAFGLTRDDGDEDRATIAALR